MKRTPRALLLFAAWVAALAILGWFVQRELVIGADLRLFLPSPTTPEQRLLLEEVGEGPASRVLAIELDGAPPQQLADISRELVATNQPIPPSENIFGDELALRDVNFYFAWVDFLEPLAPPPTTLPGDFNGDGAVDAADYVVWRKGLGTTYTQNDYGVWRAHFGASLGPGSGSALPSAEPLSAAVPEPNSFAILLSGVLLVLSWRRAVVT